MKATKSLLRLENSNKLFRHGTAQATGTQEADHRSVAAESSENQSGKAGLRRIVAGDVDIDGVDHDEEPSNPPKVSSMGESNVKPVSVKNRFSPERKT